MKYTAILIVLMASCGVQQNDYDGKKILRYNEIAGILNLDPIYAERFEDIWAMSQVFNGLVRLDSNMKVVPDLAEKWELDSTRTEYTFYLKRGIKFHTNGCFKNGSARAFNAYDVVYSFKRIMNPTNGSQGQFVFRNVANEGLFIIDDHTLKIKLNRPQQSFIKMLTLAFCYIVPEEAVEKYGKDFTRHPIGTGPFKFKIWHIADKLVFEKNPEYFEKDNSGNQLPYIDVISISFVKSAHTVFQQFLKGKLDFISGLNESYQNSLLTYDGVLREKYQDNYYLIKEPWLKTDYLGILIDPEKSIVKSSDLSKKHVRIAMNYAIDRDNLIKNIRNGIGIPANNGFVPLGMNEFNGAKVSGYYYNPALVKKHLFEAGFDGDSRKPEVVLTTQSNYKLLCEYIVRDLNENGFNARVEIMLPALHKQQIADFQTNFFRKSWTGDFPDPINFLNLYHSAAFAPDNGPNYTHFKSDEYDRLYQLAETTVSDSVQADCYLKMDQLVMDEAVVVPLFYDEIIKFVNKRVTGLQSNPMNQLNLKYVRIE